MLIVSSNSTVRDDFRRVLCLEHISRGIRYRPDTSLMMSWSKRQDGRREILFRGVNGHYFLVIVTDWKDESDHILPLSVGGAMEAFEQHPSQLLAWPQAFPNVEVRDA
jgi:hypothetical protein